MRTIARDFFSVATEDGWRLRVRRVRDPEAFEDRYRPVVIIPGYAMNSTVLAYHPTDRAMDHHLANAGFDVWAANLRAQQGCSAAPGVPRDFGMREVSVTDITAILDFVCAQTGHPRADVIGCSLGGTMVFAHLALVPDNRVAAVVALGTPLRWIEKHPLAGVVFGSAWLARRLRVKRTRALAFVGLNLLRLLPSLFDVTIHPHLVDISNPRALIKGVENPNPAMNAEIVDWVLHGDLIVAGTNITHAVRPMQNPLLVLTGFADGIVPQATARWPLDWVASTHKEYICIGDETRPYAHADLYLGRDANQVVFPRLVAWLTGNILDHDDRRRASDPRQATEPWRE